MKNIKLESRTLIKYFGKAEIFEDEISAIKTEQYLSINGYATPIDKTEAKLFQKDLSKMFKVLPDLQVIQLDGIDMKNISIPKLVKECPTQLKYMYFDGSEKYFDKLKNTKVSVSDKLKEILQFKKNEQVSEFDLANVLKVYKQYNVKGDMSAEDIDFLLKYIDLTDIGRIEIKSQEEVDKVLGLLKENDIKNMKFKIAPENLKNIQNIPQNFVVDVNIKSVKDLSTKELNDAQKKMNIKAIEITLKKLQNSLEIVDIYGVNEYKNIRNEIEKLTSDIEPEKTEIEKFLTIYQRLGKRIYYNHDENEIVNKNKENYKIFENHSLIGGLLCNSCVCEGYAKILKEALNMVGIKSRFIRGWTEPPTKNQDKNSQKDILPQATHAWNQVKIDGKWYNVDLTWDAGNIKENRKLDYCLQSDEEFINHYPKTNAEKCKESYNKKEIEKFLGISEPFELKPGIYTVGEINTLLKEYKKKNNIEIQKQEENSKIDNIQINGTNKKLETEEKHLVKYKESLWSKIKKNLKSIVDKIKDKTYRNTNEKQNYEFSANNDYSLEKEKNKTTLQTEKFKSKIRIKNNAQKPLKVAESQKITDINNSNKKENSITLDI